MSSRARLTVGFLVFVVLTGCPAKNSAPQWHGVIAYIEDPDHASEDWNWYSEDIRKGCTSFAWADASTPVVKVSDTHTVDISKSVKGRTNVWLLVDGSTVTPLEYDPTNVERAVAFCKDGG